MYRNVLRVKIAVISHYYRKGIECEQGSAKIIQKLGCFPRGGVLRMENRVIHLSVHGLAETYSWHLKTRTFTPRKYLLTEMTHSQFLP